MSTIIWTHTNKQGKTVAKYYPVNLGPKLQAMKDAWLEAQKSADALRDKLNAAVIAAIPADYTKAVPDKHELVVAHRYGTAFSALPVRTDTTRKGAVALG